MIFNSVVFGVFFILVFLLYWLVFNKNVKHRNIFLIFVSYFFYGWWDWRFLSLIIISSAIDFIVGKKLYVAEKSAQRKKLLFVSLAVNLGFLGFFKYFNFFVDSFVEAFSLFGLSMNSRSLNIVLPVGISFYTFQTLSYALDIYYKKLKPTSDIWSFFAFVSFFPQLVAGPIERARQLLPQFHELKTKNYEMFRSGIILMAWGFLKKIVIADRLAQFVDVVYGDISAAEGLPITVGAIFFTFQLYFDFSAYSDIAIGSARLLGFNLSTNFRRPYLASSFSDFWKRWHISLSSWFKDYLYIPLGGNRNGKFHLYRNIFIVFVLSGLWHGASWNFVIWGAMNAVFIILLDKMLTSIGHIRVGRILNSITVSLSWAFSLIFFRAQTFTDAINAYSKLGFNYADRIFEFGLVQPEFNFTLLALALITAFEIVMENIKDLYEWFASRHFVIRWSVYFAICLIIVFLGSYGLGVNDSSFIYFQF